MKNAFHLCGLPPQTQHPILIMRKPQDKSQLRDLTALPEKCQGDKNQDSLRNCHSPEEPAVGFCIMWCPGRDPGTEKKTFLGKKKPKTWGNLNKAQTLVNNNVSLLIIEEAGCECMEFSTLRSPSFSKSKTILKFKVSLKKFEGGHRLLTSYFD